MCQATATSGVYGDAGKLLLAAAELFAFFKEYSTVPKIAELITTVQKVKSDLYERILRDFEHLMDLGASESVSGWVLMRVVAAMSRRDVTPRCRAAMSRASLCRARRCEQALGDVARDAATGVCCGGCSGPGLQRARHSLVLRVRPD